MSPAVLEVLKVVGVALVAMLLVFFAVATDSWGSMLALVAWLAVGWYLVNRSVKPRG